jgi:hypothetical protein
MGRFVPAAAMAAVARPGLEGLETLLQQQLSNRGTRRCCGRALPDGSCPEPPREVFLCGASAGLGRRASLAVPSAGWLPSVFVNFSIRG